MTTLQPGDRVRLQPRVRGDIFDLALAGQFARVASIERDYAGQEHVVVVLDDDPGRALGPRAPAHRFFFAPGELEFVEAAAEPPEPAPPRILVAGVGNIFLGDDGFGVEVVRHLSCRREFPAGVNVVDFGIRGYDLAFALMDGYDHVILVDACPWGKTPGDVFVIEPDIEHESDSATFDAHDMHPLHVLRLARAQGATLKNVLIVGCEPVTLGPPEGQMGLSPDVEAAVVQAATVVELLIAKFLSGGEP
ncbi:MAG TPA: hydrogenase maturation protease [Gemmatimonadaceae bacterium]|jgi:hydrogenase maturation protease|nr:hydrogenase maturation protease [Gemmatimonadaceae bacterium]